MSAGIVVDEEVAARALLAGEVVGLPTDTVYGLGVVVGDDVALDRLFVLKGRPESVAIAVLVADLDQALALADDADGRLHRLGGRFWPGPLTVVARRSRAGAFRLGGDETTIGLRCPDDPVVRRLAQLLGPLAVTSANRHGDAPLTDARALAEVFPGICVLDGGVRDQPPSTVVSIVETDPLVLREGPLELMTLREVLVAGDDGE